MKTRLLASLLLLGLAGCGDVIGSGSGTFSCDFPPTKENSMMHTCSDISWSGPGAAPACGNGGSKVSSCTRSGAVGACKAKALSVGIYTTQGTTWYYSGDATKLRTDCQQSGGTWMNP